VEGLFARRIHPVRGTTAADGTGSEVAAATKRVRAAARHCGQRSSAALSAAGAVPGRGLGAAGAAPTVREAGSAGQRGIQPGSGPPACLRNPYRILTDRLRSGRGVTPPDGKTVSDAEILWDVYHHGMPLNEVARKRQLAPQRVQTIHARALPILRRRMKRQG
jgi:hypothetical protein